MRAFPAFSTKIRRELLIIEGDFQPLELSSKYRVRIEYRVGERPNVRVLSPTLVCREGSEAIPHMYDQQHLCLYLPGNNEWSGDKSLPHCFLPWISEWLLNYEMWHLTGDWLGGGIEPELCPTFRKAEGGEDERPWS